MRNPFKAPMQRDVYSSAYGSDGATTYAGQYFIAADTAGDGSASYPAMMDRDLPAGMVVDNMQENPNQPAYVGITVREIDPSAGMPVTHRDIGNHIDRSIGATIGTGDQIVRFSKGPVRGTGAGSHFTGKVQDYTRGIIRSDGPVSGTGQAYGQQLGQAYFAAQAAEIVESDRVAALLSVI